jgi:hypothetical protein
MDWYTWVDCNKAPVGCQAEQPPVQGTSNHTGLNLSPDFEDAADDKDDKPDTNGYPAACLQGTELRAFRPTLKKFPGIRTAGY